MKANSHSLNQNPVIQAYNEWNQFGKHLGMHFEVLGRGVVRYELIITEAHLATPITAHGGCIAALMDAALGVCALSCVCEELQVVSTVSMNINFLAPARVGDHLIANATMTKRGKRLVFVSCDIFNQENELIANGTATMNAYSAEKLLSV
jgi:uncharacterized protein (TIGR00369 family)